MVHSLVDHDGLLDGSAAALRGALHSLAQLTGGQCHPAAPVLELRFDAIVTLSSLSGPGAAAPLLVRALLPPMAGAGPARRMPPTALDTALEWNASAARFELWRTVPLARLRDERAILDAILASADRAQAWLIASRLSLHGR